MRIKRLALLSCVAIGLATPALAEAPGGLFKTADTNKDGVVDQAEFQASRDSWFAKLDTNKDGFVTSDELKAIGEQMRAKWQEKHPEQAQGGTQGNGTQGTQPDASRGERMVQHVLAKVDADKDGKISKAEFDTESAGLFKRLDKNADGKIASDEVPARHWGRSGGMLGRADTDKDGKITKAEFTAAGDKMFQRLDANGDGVISGDEMPVMHRRHHGQAPDGTAAPAPDQAPQQ